MDRIFARIIRSATPHTDHSSLPPQMKVVIEAAETIARSRNWTKKPIPNRFRRKLRQISRQYEIEKQSPLQSTEPAIPSTDLLETSQPTSL